MRMQGPRFLPLHLNPRQLDPLSLSRLHPVSHLLLDPGKLLAHSSSQVCAVQMPTVLLVAAASTVENVLDLW